MKFFILYINIFLLLNCAAQGTASGGPEDIKGPILLSINPICVLKSGKDINFLT